MKTRTWMQMALVAGSMALGAALVVVAQPAATPAAPAPAQEDKVIITMGEMKLTEGDFMAFLSVLPPEVRATATTPAGKRGLAEELVRLKLLANEARQRKLDETSAYRQQISVMSDNILIGLLLQDLSDDLVNDAEIQKYYADNKAKFELVTARHILVGVGPAQNEEDAKAKDAAAKAKAESIRKRIENGEDFAAIAKAESDDPTREEGGMLKPFGRGVMVPEFEKVAFELQPDQISQPVRTQFGYHIIQVKKKDVPPLDQVKDAIANQIRQEKFEGMYSELRKAVNPQFDDTFFPKPAEPAKEAPKP